MNTQTEIVAGCYWYPYRPWLRWPLRLLGALGIIMVVTKVALYHRWTDVTALLGPLWLLVVSFDTPERKPKTPRYVIGASLAWLAVVFTLLVIVLSVFAR
jgi:hypothetical protein